MTKTAQTPDTETQLRRTLTLPWLVFYGLGVTVGAGIFALIGEIVGLAGTAAPAAFLLAGLIASVTGYSYALLVSIYPLAGGEAIFVSRGIGPIAGGLAGLGVALTGIVSSATISLAFAGYASSLVGLPQWLLVISVIVVLTGIAWWGVRESVVFAAVITLLEVGTLLVVIAFGLPLFANLPPVGELVGISGGLAGLAPVLSGAVIAFFAFVGFEDIVNMAEETVNASVTAPAAIIWTLGLTVVIYVALSLIAVALPARDALVGSNAPMAVLFNQVTGFSGDPISVLAAIAMVNGILVQIIMSARILYGMAGEGLIPAWFGTVDRNRRTPARATFFVAAIILILALTLPLIHLAELTSLIILAVFTTVNLALYRLATRDGAGRLGRWRYWGIFGALLAGGILLSQLVIRVAGLA